MLIVPFVRRGISIIAILCSHADGAWAQTVAHQRVVDAIRGETTLPVDASALEKAGPYTTMCVRTCDGFYFPLHQNEHPRNFARDAQTCASKCGSAARLFYFPLRSGNPATMIDLEGRRYVDEPQAFAFHRSIVQGCACKPQPWSAEAAARHQKYSAEAAEKRLRLEAITAARARAGYSAAAARDYDYSDSPAQGSLR